MVVFIDIAKRFGVVGDAVSCFVLKGGREIVRPTQKDGLKGYLLPAGWKGNLLVLAGVIDVPKLGGGVINRVAVVGARPSG